MGARRRNSHLHRFTTEERTAIVSAAQAIRGGITTEVYAGVAALVAGGKLAVTNFPSRQQFHRWLRGNHPDSKPVAAPGERLPIPAAPDVLPVSDGACAPEPVAAAGGPPIPQSAAAGSAPLAELRPAPEVEPALLGAAPTLTLAQLNQRLDDVAIRLLRAGAYDEIRIQHKRLNKALGKLIQGELFVRDETTLRQDLVRFIHRCGARLASLTATPAECPVGNPATAGTDVARPSLDSGALPAESPTTLVSQITASASTDETPALAEVTSSPEVVLEADDCLEREGVMMPLYRDPRSTEEEGADWGASLALAELALPPTGTVMGATMRTKADEQAEFRARVVAPVLNGEYTAEEMAALVRAGLAGRGGSDARMLVQDMPPEDRRRFLKLTARTIQRWCQQVREAEAARRVVGDTAPVALTHVLRHANPAKRSPRVAGPAVVELLRNRALDPACADWTARDFKDEVRAQLGVHVSERTIQRVLSQELSDMDRIRARGGSDAVDLVFRRYLYREAPYANHAWIIDHSHVSQDALDLADGAADCKDFDFELEYVGEAGRARPATFLWVTAIKDAYSRRTLALRFWAKAPGITETLVTLYDAIRRYGIPDLIYSDNGADFCSNVVRHVLQLLGIHHIKTRPYTPQGRAKLERWFRTLKERYFKLIPGYRGGRHPRATDPADLWTIERIERLVRARVEEDEACERHSETRRCPAEHFEESIGARRAVGSWLRGDERSLPFLLPMRVVKSTVSGFQFLGRRYYTERLRRIPVGAELRIHYDPSDLTVVFVTVAGAQGKVVFVGPAEYYDRDHQPPSFRAQQDAEAQVLREVDRQREDERARRVRTARVVAADAEAARLVAGEQRSLPATPLPASRQLPAGASAQQERPQGSIADDTPIEPGTLPDDEASGATSLSVVSIATAPLDAADSRAAAPSTARSAPLAAVDASSPRSVTPPERNDSTRRGQPRKAIKAAADLKVW